VDGWAAYWDSAGSTDAGLVRPYNEDSFLNRPDSGFWIVADGMGGHDCGDVASQALCAAFADLPNVGDLTAAVDFIDERVIDVNRELRELAFARHAGSVIGSTFVALVARGRYAACLWAGDSRLYRLRDGLLVRLSDDHSLVEESQYGLASPDNEQANVITRAVGAEDQVFLDVDVYELMEGDRFMLCSDGLNKEVNDDEISRLMSAGSASDCTAELIAKALDAGGSDNVTVVVADCLTGSGQ
jgi:type VI secretion system protein ImpM